MTESNYFKNIEEIDTNTLHFDIHNIDLSLVNALRRIIMSEVPTVGFRTEPYEKSNVKIITNTSSLHNEFISHRFGMIPIHIKNVDIYNNDEYKFILNVTNETSEIIDVTTKDIQVLKINRAKNEYEKISDEDRNAMFPPDPISKNHILINRLKPDTSGQDIGEVLHIEATAVVSNGQENARWSPVSQVSFTNKVDTEKTDKVLLQLKNDYKSKNNIDTLSPQIEKGIEHRFNIFEANRHFHVNSKNEPNIFEFKIESIGALNPKYIFMKALDILKTKINTFLINLNNDSDIVTIKESNNLQNTIDIEILNENHTLGNLIQSHFNYYDELNEKNFCKDKDNINYIGYYEPHPLDDKIILRIGLKKSYEKNLESSGTQYDRISNIKNIIETCLKKIMNLCDKLGDNFEKL